MRTLMDSATSDRPERRTAIIARELRRYRIDLAALSETRLADEGQLKEEKGGYTFFGKEKLLMSPGSMVFELPLGTSLSPTSMNFLWGISERLMTIRLVLANNQIATVVSAYAPTLDSEEEVKETFYACLDETLSRIPRKIRLFFLEISMPGLAGINTSGRAL